jgi:hypothetical protein
MAAVIAHGGTDARIESKNLPGSIPANIRPPGERVAEPPTGSTMSLASTESRPAPAPRASTQVASAGPGFFGGLFSSSDESAKSGSDSQSDGVLGKMSRLVGLHGSDPADAPTAAKTKPVAAKPAQTASAGAIKPKPAAGSAAAPAAPTPAQSDVKAATAGTSKPPAEAAQPVETANNTSLLRGAQATVPAGGFDSRWGAMR